MSKKYARLAMAAATTDVGPKERERIAQLLATNRSDTAVDAAKAIHKRCGNAESESLLLDAYGARVRSLMERRLDREAAALMDLVRERYPSAVERLKEWSAVIAARNGDLGELLGPLKDPALPAEKQAAIGALIRRDVVDLHALAECAVLDADHPLRIAAAALWRAFEAVTSGPVAEDALALPEVSRSSPLAPWKMLVRAIAAYYRQDDALCRKCVEAIEPASAAARLTPPLRKLIHLPQSLTATGERLVNQVDGNANLLRSILKGLESEFEDSNHPAILEGIRRAVAACREAEPELLDRLKQHLSIRCTIVDIKRDKVVSALGASSLKDAHFWRLLARAHEQEGGSSMALGSACGAWEEFRKHALREHWFPAKGAEIATLYLHMAELLGRMDPETLARVRFTFERKFDFHKDHYRDQPAVIRALMPSPGNLTFLSPEILFERACEADPCRENFERWMRYTAESSPVERDRVAERWCSALPRDIAPLLHLMQSAEERNALQKAFQLMERAEKIDGLNPEVRRARLRLLISMTVRHLRDRKPKLAEKDLRQIEALPQAKLGDRPAFVAALRFVWCLTRDAEGEADAAYAEGVRLLGDEPTAQFLFLEVERRCGRRSSALGKPQQRPNAPLFAAFGRVCALGEDMGIEVELIDPMPAQMMKELSAPHSGANPRALEALGEAAIRNEAYPLAYMVAGAGLAQGAESQAQFLFLRSRALPPWEQERRDTCLASAAELARHRHDFDLLKRIGEWRDLIADWIDVPDRATAAMGTREAERVVEREIREKMYPTSRPPFDDYENNDDDTFDGPFEDDSDCQCPSCRAKRGQLPPELRELAEQLGPEAVMRALADLLNPGGKKKRGRRQSRLDDSDVPF